MRRWWARRTGEGRTTEASSSGGPTTGARRTGGWCRGCSAGGAGDRDWYACPGHTVIESWHSTLEFELRDLEHFTTRAPAHHRVPAWIEEYNHDRRHSS